MIVTALAGTRTTFVWKERKRSGSGRKATWEYHGLYRTVETSYKLFEHSVNEYGVSISKPTVRWIPATSGLMAYVHRQRPDQKWLMYVKNAEYKPTKPPAEKSQKPYIRYGEPMDSLVEAQKVLDVYTRITENTA